MASMSGTIIYFTDVAETHVLRAAKFYGRLTADGSISRQAGLSVRRVNNQLDFSGLRFFVR